MIKDNCRYLTRIRIHMMTELFSSPVRERRGRKMEHLPGILFQFGNSQEKEKEVL